MAREDDLPQRDKELATRKDSKFSRELIETFSKIHGGFEEQAARALYSSRTQFRGVADWSSRARGFGTNSLRKNEKNCNAARISW